MTENVAGRTVARLWLVFATVLWGLSFPLGKAAGMGVSAQVPEAEAALVAGLPLAWRFVAAAGLLLLLARSAAVPRKASEVFHGTVLGLSCAGGLGLQMAGLQAVDASLSAFLTQLGCVWVPFLVALDKRVWPAGRIWLALILVLGGGAVLTEFEPSRMRLGHGELLTLLGTAFFAFQIYWLERDDFARQAKLPCTWVMFVVIGLVFSGISWALAPQASVLVAPLASIEVWLPVVGLTLFCTLGAFTLMNRYQPSVTATEAGIIYGLESVFAALLALFLPGWLQGATGLAYANEVPDARLVLGGGFILAATLLAALPASSSHGHPKAE